MADLRYVYIRREGCAMHPDDVRTDLTPAQYDKQLRQYLVDTGDRLDDLYCSSQIIKGRILADMAGEVQS